jgi:hypothetical protein
MKKIKLILILSALISLVGITSCNDKTVEPTNQTQSLSLNFSAKVGTKDLDYTSSFTTDAGARYTVSMFRYYVSNIRLIKSDGTEYPINNKYLLVTPSVANYDLGQVPVGSYKGIKFSVGIDSVTNHADPTVYPVTNPLAIQSPAIHWSWNSGYIFMMIEGSCDTTVANNDVLTYGQYSHGMFYHIGMDPLLRTIDLSNAAFTVSSANSATVSISADLNKVLKNVDIKTENASHTMGSMPLATRIADNISSAFSVK